MYCTGQDDESSPNTMTTTKSVVVTTAVDQTPPQVLSGYPTGTNVQDFAFDVQVQLNEPGTCSYVVTAYGVV